MYRFVITIGVFALCVAALSPLVTANEYLTNVEAPTSQAVVDQVVPLPPVLQSYEMGTVFLLTELTPKPVKTFAQIVPAIAEDGTLDESAARLAYSVPAQVGPALASVRRFGVSDGVTPDDIGQPAFTWSDISETSWELKQGDENVLTYNHGTIVREDIPETERRRARGCYIHPLYGMNGEVLTDDFPRDHYHHHGVFWTWPHVGVDGTDYDLWTDVGGLHQEFVRLLSKEAGSTATVLGVENKWVVEDKTVMIERVWITVYSRSEMTRSVDLDFVWIPTDEPVTLQGAAGKSYGGLTVRFRPPTSKDPSTLITVPDGPTTGDLSETPLPWADYTSRFTESESRSGAAVFVPKTHADYPPTWLTRHYGPLCIGWPGVKARTFEPGELIPLSYRLWVHEGPVETNEIQAAYDAYVR
jgi:hypothetical protein